MNKKMVKFDDRGSAKHLTARNKISRRKSTPHVSKCMKSAAPKLSRKVDTDSNNLEEKVQDTKIIRQATPYHINKKFGSNCDDLRSNLFSVEMDKSDMETSLTFAASSPLVSIKSTSKPFKTPQSPNDSMKVQEIICNNKNNSMTLEFEDGNLEDYDVFNPSSDSFTFNGSYEKIGIRPKKRKISKSNANKKRKSPSPIILNVPSVEQISPVENESESEELHDETVEVLSGEEDYDVFNPSSDSFTFNGPYVKKGIRPKKRKISKSKASKKRKSPSPIILNVPPVEQISPVENESESEELSNEPFHDEIVEVLSGEEDMQVENLQKWYKKSVRYTSKDYSVFSHNDINFLVLSSNRRLYFNGSISITVLHGEVEVLGYTLTSSSNSQEVYSPRGSSHLYFEAKPCMKNQYDNGFIAKMEKLIPEKDMTTFKEVAKTDSCVLMYENLQQEEIKFVEKHIAQTLFHEKGCVFQKVKGDWNVMNVDPKWEEIANSMIFNSKLLLTGGKGVGKSTMLRYILNKLLLKHSAVVVIDLDPGQPEFTLPGCISFHIIKEPVFGPNYTHQRTPYRSVFVSNMNVSTNPRSYLRRVEDLYSSGGTEAGYPTIINYVGLTKECGLDLLSTIIYYVKPTMVVEIRSENESRNYVEPLSRDLLANSKLYSPSLYISTEEFPKFKIEVVSSLSGSSRGWILSPRNVREMNILHYFGKIFPEDDLNLESTPDFVYKINISDIKLKYHHKECKVNIIDQSLVAMCSDTGMCYGWGIVCTVDLEKNELYIQTPMPANQLPLISVLNRGSVRLPPCFYMAYNYPNIPNKFLSVGILEDTGRLPMRSFLPASHYQK